MRSRALLGLVFVSVLFASACSSGYDRDSAYDDLVGDDFGFTGEQADCILDRVESEGLEDAIVEDDPANVPDDEKAAVGAILDDCVLAGDFDTGGVDTSGADTAGTDTAGTDTAGTDTAGTDTAGTDTAGTDGAEE